jgi:hypothetical protein
MAEPEIIRKIREELNKGISTEPQVVYLLAEMRKLLEQQDALCDPDYEYLVFHCDWALHSRLDRRMARKILALFDSANVRIQAGMKLEDLPESIQTEFNNIAGLKYFKDELYRFLQQNSLPTLKNDWERFEHLYTSVIQDCPLVMSSNNPEISIKNVTVSVGSVYMDLAKMTEGVMPGSFLIYLVDWLLIDKNGESTEFIMMNSYS